MKPLAIDGPRCLRPLDIQDAEAWFTVLEAHRDFLLPLIPTPGRIHTLDDAVAYMRRAEADHRSGTAYRFGLWQAGDLQGEVLLFSVRSADRCAELGYWLAEDAQGKGLMSWACREIVSFAFGELGLNRLELRTPTENARSQALARKLGFTREGTLRQAHRLNGRFPNYQIFGLLASEWRPQGRPGA